MNYRCPKCGTMNNVEPNRVGCIQCRACSGISTICIPIKEPEVVDAIVLTDDEAYDEEEILWDDSDNDFEEADESSEEN